MFSGLFRWEGLLYGTSDVCNELCELMGLSGCIDSGLFKPCE